jgi:hypothetical protein
MIRPGVLHAGGNKEHSMKKALPIFLAALSIALVTGCSGWYSDVFK